MINKVIESLVEILNHDAYTNIVVNNVISETNFSDHEKRLYTRLVYGVVENKLLLDYLLQPLISGQRVKPYIKNALRLGVYAIDNLNIKDYYIVKEIVQKVKKKDFKASSFVNAILRRYQSTERRSLNNLSKNEHLSLKYSLNLELVELLEKQYPNQLEEIVKPIVESINTYRINTLKITSVELKKILDEMNITYEILNDVILQTKVSLIASNLFKKGLIIPQDKSSIMVGIIASPTKGMNILDACSAPGGKTLHLASIIENEGSITACDIYEHKLSLIEENAMRLGVTCVKTKLADATKEQFNEEFDLILTDVPCSGLGVIKHKPDLKYHMNNIKINEIKQLQKQIVENTLKYLKKGGILVYSTCTINKEENEYFIETLLKKHSNLEKIEEIITLPTDTEDGFYICKLKDSNNEK